MSVADYNVNPSLNTSISGIFVGEGMAAGDMNGAFRQMMADLKALYNGLPDISTLVTKTGGVFTGNPTFTGAGGYLFNANGSNTGGRITVQPIGGAEPASPTNGDWWAEY